MRKIIRMGKIESLMMNGGHEKIEEEGGKGIREGCKGGGEDLA